MKLRLSALAAAALALAAPAHAGYVRTDYSGIVYFSPTSSLPVSFDVVYDTSKLVDRTASIEQGIGFLPAGVTDIQTVSLSDDPSDSLTIKFGSQTFTKFDGLKYGTACGDVSPCGPGDVGLGAGDLPAATYINGKFAGVSNILLNANGISIDSDPVADALGGFQFGGVTYQLVVSAGTPDNPFAQPFGVGFYDAADATITPFPGPETWALMITGLAGAGLVLRRRKPMAHPGLQAVAI